MLTLAQAQNLSQSKLTNKIIDEFRKCPLLDAIPFDNTVKPQGGKTLAYVFNRITTQPTAGARKINGEYTSQETVTTPTTVVLKVMGGSYELDRVIANDEKQVVDHVQFQSTQKAKATRVYFLDQFINGDVAVDADGFDGIDKAVKGTITERNTDTVLDLSTSEKIDSNYKKLLYEIRKVTAKMSQKPTHYCMNSDMYAVFQTIADRVPNIRYDKSSMGDEIIKYGTAVLVDMGDKPGTTKPIVEINEDGETSLYAVVLDLEGVHGVSPDGNDLIKHYYPDFKTAGAVKKGEVEMVGAIAVEATRSVGVIRKIKIAEVEYTQTSDTKYLADKTYYSKETSGAYKKLTAGTDYTVGGDISGTVYEKTLSV